MDNSSSAQNLISDLREEYVRDVPERMFELEQAFTRAHASRNQEDAQVLSDLVHRMHGTSGTLLFEELSACALQLELRLEALIQARAFADDTAWQDVVGILTELKTRAQALKA